MPTHLTIALSIATGLMLASGFAVSEEDSSASTDTVKLKKEKETDRIRSTLPSQEADAIKLESVFVGDKEQPAISYFIPWQGIGTPDKLHWNVEQKHDNALDIVDREIMLRSMHIYEEMELEAPKILD